jgi:hypothetical protein
MRNLKGGVRIVDDTAMLVCSVFAFSAFLSFSLLQLTAKF